MSKFKHSLDGQSLNRARQAVTEREFRSAFKKSRKIKHVESDGGVLVYSVADDRLIAAKMPDEETDSHKYWRIL